MSPGWLLRRVLLALLAAFGVSVLVFVLLRLVPGDVVTQLIGLEGNVSAAQQAEMRRLFGLNEPIWQQFAHWFWALLHGNLGISLRTDRPVFQDLLLRFPVTLQLTGLALLFAALIGLPLGILAALKRGKSADLLSSTFVLVGLAAPEFWLAILMILLFSLKLGWFPPNGYVTPAESLAGNLRSLFLPALALSFSLAAATTRIVRASLLDVLGQDYIRTARAKGLPGRAIVVRHALRNALIPVVTVIGLQVGNLLGGAVIIEQLFGLPGVGRYALEGINLRDYPVVQGAVLWIAVSYVLVNVIVDVLYGVIDRRVVYS
ncbi:peptide/nickel transport system permease protein [Deinococcus metalli]|uniref:ABC di/oligopeptide transporter inner membrane subunit n=1 Tax=Deinococcus metalli TaxID=1141878 RepID=A0A7W8KE90_9DEIO|nr:ABC transporter permease [Deinococcus metalli]MBB5376570.1 peptide/nickel transport system permease protein [Deinococcus metalli]GHF43063.1 ABC di/oligopeptide transporter inner membrane subunit [Deinococcus metalli]